MSYRDELEAARERADALERELEEKEKALAERAKAIADKDKAIAEKEQALAEVAAEKKRHDEDAARAEAGAAKSRDALDALAAKGSKPKPVPKPPKVKMPPSPAAGRRRRILRSVIWAGGLALDPDCFLLSLPSTGMLGFLFGMGLLKLPAEIALPAGAAVPPVVSYVLLPLYASLKLLFLRRWPGTLPYRLEGYPELLGIRPRNKGTKGFFAELGHSASLDRGFNPGGHTGLRLTLHFSKAPPENLATIMSGFDPALKEVRQTSESHDRVFGRESPVSESYSKSGRRQENSDENYHVHRWIRRCHRKVLRHLVSEHLTSATISLY